MVTADQLETKREALRAFAASGSGRVVIAAVLIAVVMRAAAASWSWFDAAIVGITLGATGIVEWVLHLFLLHASPASWTSRRLGTGVRHRQHHLDPGQLQWLLLRGIDAALFVVLISLATLAWTLALVVIVASLGADVSGWASALSGIVAALAALLHYEWTHLLVHTRYRPRTRYYQRLARNHRLHHYRNERYWLGVTSNVGDRLLRTYPESKSDVSLSDTARTLS